jgi:RND family efflux transporter MFP subunit
MKNKGHTIFRFLFLMLSFSFLIILISSCNNTPSNTAVAKPAVKLTEDEKPKVTVLDLKNGTFYKEIISNGKLYAIRKADLKFRVTEVIEKINVKNGDMVEKGAVLAKLNIFTYDNRLQRARSQFEKAKLDLQDVLIGLGYKTVDSTRIPPSVWKIARIKSGLDNAFFDLQTAEFDYQNTILKAPFRGTVCNLKAKEQNMASLDAFCTLVDNSTFEAVFQILEPELRNLSENQLVSVVPFAMDTVAQPGTVTEINPLVDENGLVTVKAKVTNSRNILYEGMNVRVLVRRAFPNRLVVPKTAVVLRTGKEVVFTLEGKLAKWNYVKTNDENTTSYSIAEGLKSGMKVIISGNLNLGHDAEVEVIKGE